MPPLPCSRRRFLQTTAAAGAAAALRPAARLWADGPAPQAVRRFHVCLSPDALDADPELLATVAAAGVGTVWLPAFLYGHWPYSLERLTAWRGRIAARGLDVQAVNVPLGHPGDSLGAMNGDIPLSPPERWRTARHDSGVAFVGTSLHPPATHENADAVRRLQTAGFKQVFLDDDFRLAVAPGQIGGCFCDAHRSQFLEAHGYAAARWEELLGDLAARRLTALARDWIGFQCDALTACFRAQQAAAPDVALGNMVMFLGAEKAGIRLADYRDATLRVGEWMFDDGAFGSVKGKTDELFSSLFHRRFVAPELAYSETTAYPVEALSATNMAAKLAVSLLSDVRHTMFMSGLTPFPRTHWDTLGPAMKRQSELHPVLAGHRPRGPFKHYWGEAERRIGDDRPFSLFLAAGVPFEVTDEPAGDGWTFLGDFDARAAAAGALKSAGTTFVVRPEAGPAPAEGRAVPESLDALFRLKAELLPRLADVPVVVEEQPVVLAWYPTARRVLLWNLSETRETFTIRLGAAERRVTVDGLGVALAEPPTS